MAPRVVHSTVTGATADPAALVDGPAWDADHVISGLDIGSDVQAHDDDLDAIAALTPLDDDIIQRKGGTWANRSPAQYIADLGALGTTFQPLDSDLTAIAALSTTSYGRGLLTLANAAALAAEVDPYFLTPAEGNAAYQPLDSDLTAIAALSTTSFGRAFLTLADAAASRTYLSLVPGADIQAYDSDLAALASNSTNGLWVRTGAGTGSARTITGTANAISVTNGDGVSGNPTLAISSDASLPGNPTTTTQALNNNSTRIATTAFLFNQVSNATPLGNLANGAAGTSTLWSRADHVHPGREVLTANRTYYVRTDGSDSNTGLANTAGGAFLTIQKAVDLIASTLDIAGYIVTIQIADGTYTGAVTLKNVVGFGATGDLVIRGNNTTPANVVISVTSSTCFTANGISSVWDILDLKMQTTTSGNCLLALAGAKMRWGNTDFGACAGNHIQALGPGSTLTSLSNYAITGSASDHFQAYYGGVIITPGRTITITGTLSIGIFADMRVLGSGQLFSLTFAGTYTVTGTRYRSQENSVCFVNGAGATYFPGSIGGSTSTGGLYV